MLLPGLWWDSRFYFSGKKNNDGEKAAHACVCQPGVSASAGCDKDTTSGTPQEKSFPEGRVAQRRFQKVGLLFSPGNPTAQLDTEQRAGAGTLFGELSDRGQT